MGGRSIVSMVDFEWGFLMKGSERLYGRYHDPRCLLRGDKLLRIERGVWLA